MVTIVTPSGAKIQTGLAKGPTGVKGELVVETKPVVGGTVTEVRLPSGKKKKIKTTISGTSRSPKRIKVTKEGEVRELTTQEKAIEKLEEVSPKLALAKKAAAKVKERLKLSKEPTAAEIVRLARAAKLTPRETRLLALSKSKQALEVERKIVREPGVVLTRRDQRQEMVNGEPVQIFTTTETVYGREGIVGTAPVDRVTTREPIPDREGIPIVVRPGKEQEFLALRQPKEQEISLPSRLVVVEPPKTFEEKFTRVLEKGRREPLGDSFGTSLTSFAAGFGTSLLGTYQFGKKLVTDPVTTAKETGKSIFEVGKRFVTREGFPEIGKVLRQEPAFASGFVAGEALSIEKISKAGRLAAKTTKRVTTRLSPSYVAFTEEGLNIRSGVLPDDVVKIEPAGTVKSISEPLAEQVRIAGQEVDAISAQRGLFGPLERQKVVDKPLPTPDAPPLERAFFADPRGRLRVSRLGITDQKEAGIIDILTGDVTFKKEKPQVLVFEKAKVAEFPKELIGIEKKLKEGKTLTAAEEAKLLEFQLEPTGEFKPVGFLSKEPEITLAPGEVITKQDIAAVTEIGGFRVPVIRAGVKKPSKKVRDILEKVDEKPLTKKEKVLLEKETGFSVKEISSDIASRRPFISPTYPGLSGAFLVKDISRISPRVRDIRERPSILKPSLKPSDSLLNVKMYKDKRYDLPSDIYSPLVDTPSVSPPTYLPPTYDVPSYISPPVSPPVKPPKYLTKPPIIPKTKKRREPVERFDLLRTFTKKPRLFEYSPDIEAVVLGETRPGEVGELGVFTGVERRRIIVPKWAYQRRVKPKGKKPYVKKKKFKKDKVLKVKKKKRGIKKDPLMWTSDPFY